MHIFHLSSIINVCEKFNFQRHIGTEHANELACGKSQQWYTVEVNVHIIYDLILKHYRLDINGGLYRVHSESIYSA